MPRSTTVNADLASDLRRLGGDSSLSAGVEGALAMVPGELGNAAEFPVLGYYFTTGDAHFLLFAVTPGRLVRYEIGGSRSLTVTVPMSRVSRVAEEIGEEGVTVLLELDADAVGAQFESTGRVAGPESAQAGLARLSPTTYELKAEPADAARLVAFSRAARSALGL